VKGTTQIDVTKDRHIIKRANPCGEKKDRTFNVKSELIRMKSTLKGEETGKN